MQVGNSTSAPIRPRGDGAPTQTADAREAARRQRAADEATRERAAQDRSADRLEEVRVAVARVIGANTRLSISRSENSPRFVYRAIDIVSGEVVFEWPEDKFVDLIRGVRDDVRTDIDAGTILDRVA